METHPSYLRYITKGKAEVLSLFSETANLIVYFHDETSPESRQLKPDITAKAEKYANCLVAMVNQMEPGNRNLILQFNVTTFPLVLVFNMSLDNLVYRIVGYDPQQLQKVFKNPELIYKLKDREFLCPQNHKLEQTSSLPWPYSGNIYECDLCKRMHTATQFHKLMHCPTCNYDICYQCCHEPK